MAGKGGRQSSVGSPSLLLAEPARKGLGCLQPFLRQPLRRCSCALLPPACQLAPHLDTLAAHCARAVAAREALAPAGRPPKDAAGAGGGVAPAAQAAGVRALQVPKGVGGGRQPGGILLMPHLTALQQHLPHQGASAVCASQPAGQPRPSAHLDTSTCRGIHTVPRGTHCALVEVGVADDAVWLQALQAQAKGGAGREAVAADIETALLAAGSLCCGSSVAKPMPCQFGSLAHPRMPPTFLHTPCTRP